MAVTSMSEGGSTVVNVQYCYVLILERLKGGRPLMVRDNGFVVIGVTNFLGFANVLSHSQDIVRFQRTYRRYNFTSKDQPGGRCSHYRLTARQLVSRQPPFTVVLSIRVLSYESSSATVILLL